MKKNKIAINVWLDVMEYLADLCVQEKNRRF
jgi:hypothetical protein